MHFDEGRKKAHNLLPKFYDALRFYVHWWSYNNFRFCGADRKNLHDFYGAPLCAWKGILSLSTRQIKGISIFAFIRLANRLMMKDVVKSPRTSHELSHRGVIKVCCVVVESRWIWLIWISDCKAGDLEIFLKTFLIFLRHKLLKTLGNST
jgi:hypothetical protein